jgi:thiamine-phosphate pyrophosphorylase
MIDAAVNRASEGLRVAEDYVRFVLDDPHLTRLAKALRHKFAAAAAMIAATDRHSARESQQDVGRTISTASEQERADTWAVCVASLKRAQQSLRSLEEYGKLADAKFAEEIERIRYRLYTLEKAIDTERTSLSRLEGVRLCVLVDGRETVEDFERLVTSLVEAGVGMIQLRDKRLSDRDLAARARALKASIRDKPTLAIVNDRPDVAAATHVDGVHLGQEDLSVKDARTIVGTRMLVGVSTHSLDQARAAALEGANYLGAGPTFPSRTSIPRTRPTAGHRRRNPPADLCHRRNHGRQPARRFGNWHWPCGRQRRRDDRERTHCRGAHINEKSQRLNPGLFFSH